MEEKTSELVHVKQFLSVEYDFNPVTGETFNIQSKVTKTFFGSDEVRKESKEKSVKEALRLTIEDVAERSKLPIITLSPKYYKLNKTAASEMGITDDNGKVFKNELDKNISLCIRFKKDKDTKEMYPLLYRVDNTTEQLSNGSPSMVRDSLSVSCSGGSMELLEGFGKYFKVIVSKVNPKFSKLVGYDSLKDLLIDNEVKIPDYLLEDKNEETLADSTSQAEVPADTETPVNEEDQLPWDNEEGNDSLDAPKDEEPYDDDEEGERNYNALRDADEQPNGSDSVGDEFIPAEFQSKEDEVDI